MSIKAIIWDLGGVLVRTEDRRPREWLAARFEMTGESLLELVFGAPGANPAQLGEVSADEHWGAVGEKLGVSAEDLPAMRAEFFAGDVVDKELVEHIRELKKTYRSGLLSNAISDLRDYIEGKWEIGDAFDEMIISAEVGLMKPDAQIYQLACEKLGVKAEESVFIDDFENNVQGAMGEGLKGIHFESREQILGELKEMLGGK